MGLFVDFFVRLFTQLKFGVVQACILFMGLGVSGRQQLLTLLSCLEVSLTADVIFEELRISHLGLRFFIIIEGHERKTLIERCSCSWLVRPEAQTPIFPDRSMNSL